ncbi:MAG TPA: class I SAM-dependent methyltransferase [Acidimicrobiia bacterium]|nr:class I SAM-dependent methyltransferase [Acidimicrobiia bacterium]
MLTVDFDRLDLRSGQRLLDLGCGGGRHSYEAMRRGATVVALDADVTVVRELQRLVSLMVADGEFAEAPPGGALHADALALPFPDGSFDRVIASEVLEHIWADERAIVELNRILAPGGKLAVTVPTRFPERVCWALDAEYHSAPGGHIRIYRQRDLETKLAQGGLVVRDSHHAHALHSPYWWLRCAVGVQDADQSWPVQKYRDFLTWQIMKQPRWVESVDRALNPVLGKSLVVYTEKVGP